MLSIAFQLFSQLYYLSVLVLLVHFFPTVKIGELKNDTNFYGPRDQTDF